ncbi:MAG: helix-turn-helix transcriptional regulator [Chlorobium sp.]|jgi:transcriptional regulator with XRE-family HTH domain|uniref:helix-turn-helix domain-containing protein n=1 Tax=Chlorobium sp. TaxID=1095 RepID=UPI001DF1BBE5|nr:helix-turn-helix domain-containing protein [Chlorobium sp.]MBN1278696.1 helix-turn-helix domain-containing protein [Chlorobiaceae bacterium]MCF8216929.1 helix-turn-helix transcriptional regulator [Chlorobium sp.]MCF8271745.1 helix-turn-helix transcriptional regulator [Chlorobium sp.]MCF8288146.1 helix-turn-helix transcriptional regulator [Chlorobium sp.]MCF8291724.1 helix-turn-helix transcriptional regulator [Chlorobium sp.]
MKIEGTLTDEEILGELGGRLAQRRLELQLSQEALAEQAGVSKRTVERVEAGTTTQISSIIRVMRVLGLLERLEALVPEAGPRPLELLKLKDKARKRARTKQKPAEEKPWTWGDES